MLSRFVPLALLISAPLAAQEAAPALHATALVRLETAEGPIDIAVETERAPITAKNFLAYVDQRRFDGTALYRAVKVQAGYGLVQGGVNNDPRKVLKPIAHEPTSQTGLSHTDGAVSMARNAPGTAAGDFFIVIGDLVSMDAQPGGDPGFAVFGKVTGGMDLVRKTLDAPTDPAKGAPAMAGQMLVTPLKIITARRAQ